MTNIKKDRKVNLIFSTFLAFTLLNIIDLPIQTDFFNTRIDFSQQALAKRRGGRSGGGSFRSRSSNSRSKRRTSNSTRRRSSRDSSVIIESHSYHHSHGYGYGYGHGGGMSLFNLIFLIMFFGFFGFILYLAYAQHQAEKKAMARELREDLELENQEKNRKVTISKLQVALTAEAKDISKQLSQLTLNTDTDTKSGLVELLQESIVILLRNSESWTHILSRSIPVKIDKGEAAFNRLSIAQRSKFSIETVSNINGKIRSNSDDIYDNDDQQNDDIPAYVIVTILVGSDGEQPLFNQIRSCEELKETLEKLAAIDEEELIKLEVLWTPQSDDESLTNDEFIMEYTDMIQLV